MPELSPKTSFAVWVSCGPASLTRTLVKLVEPTPWRFGATATRERRATIKVGTRPFGVTIDAEGKRAYTANVGSNDVSVIDIAASQEIGRVPVGMRPYAVALTQGRGFVTDQYGGTVSVFDLATLKPVKRINVGDYPEGINATADGKRVIVACWESNTLSIIDATELKVIGEVKTGDGPRAFGAFLRRTE